MGFNATSIPIVEQFRVGDNASVSILRNRLGVDLRHDQGNVRIAPEMRCVVDHNTPCSGRDRRELSADVATAEKSAIGVCEKSNSLRS